MTFTQDSSGSWCYIDPGSNKLLKLGKGVSDVTLILIGATSSNTSFDVKSKVADYKSATADDFILDLKNASCKLWDGYGVVWNNNGVKSYDANNGILRVYNISASSQSSYAVLTIEVYYKQK